MILVTTGYFVPFTRLFKAADAFAKKSGEEVIVQGHIGDFKFSSARHQDEIQNLREFMKKADVVVSQGAMSMVEALELGCRLVVVPRQKKYGEIINDHQIEFSNWVCSKHPFQLLLEVADLGNAIESARSCTLVAPDFSSRRSLEAYLREFINTLKK